MNFRIVASAMVLAVAAAGCQQIPDQMSLAEYCANPDNLNKDVCKINVEIDGQKRALAETNMSVGQARQVAENALQRANAAQASADAAQHWLAFRAAVQCSARPARSSAPRPVRARPATS